MDSISCKEMGEMDRYAIEKIGIPSLILMENAGLKVLNNLNLRDYDNFTIVCGVGNNGGDGLVVARHLFILGKNVRVFLIGDETRQSGDSKINLEILLRLGLKIEYISRDADLEAFEKSLNETDLILDGIFGTGLKRQVYGMAYKLIETINESGKYIVAIDIPSGLNGDDGKVYGICVNANKTITFHMLKHGHLDNTTYTGEVIVEKIGIPNIATKEVLAKSRNI